MAVFPLTRREIVGTLSAIVVGGTGWLKWWLDRQEAKDAEERAEQRAMRAEEREKARADRDKERQEAGRAWKNSWCHSRHVLR